MSDAKTICERLILAADLADMGRKPEKNDYRRLAAALIEKQAIELSARRTVSGQEAEKDAALTDDEIRRIFMANGFTIKEGQSDLKPYVYAAARAILAATKEPQ